MNNPSVVILTPTVGSDHLEQCLKSVSKQTYAGKLNHLIVIDGPQYTKKVYEIFDYINPSYAFSDYVTTLHDNVGGNGWYGHRVYAAYSYLVNEDYIIYLDEDNYFEPNHVESLIKTIQDKKLAWAFSFRNIVDKESNFICQDNCESLGKWPSVGNYLHVDTSAFCINRELAAKNAHNWYGQ